jgi:Intracellular proteinase inhibitor
MNRRPPILIVAAGALALACGPSSHSDATPPLASAAARFTAPVQHLRRRASKGAAALHAAKEEVKLDSRFDVKLDPSAVHFALGVTNRTHKHIELSFASGQSYDFVVIDSTGREVWHWADGRMFTQAIRNKQLSRGETMQVEETWDTVASGHYTAIATFKSINYPTEQRVEFVVP